MRYTISVTAITSTHIKAIVLSIPFRKEVAKYAMGKFGVSGFVPDEKTVAINGGLMYNVIWGGDYNATKNTLPVLTNWENNGKGYYKLVKNNKSVIYEIHNGEQSLKKGDTIQLDFAFIITPFKPLTDFRWDKRIYHPAYSRMPQDDQAKPVR
ncbi:MAG: hypothetical protein J7L96_07540 [Bacteroidales bacterium]|nr:hypothetical protein [Bacteroidales bacterium]